MNKSYNIHEKWTDLDKVNNVEISSVNGVIEEILVNGEPAGGGGDFTIANVIFINSLEGSDPYQVKFMELTENGLMAIQHDVNYGENVTCNLPLYKGRAIYDLNNILEVDTSNPITTTGGVVANDLDNIVTITEDGSFTAAGKPGK